MNETYVVVCASCGQAWGVARPLMPSAQHPILVPYHTRAIKRTGIPGATPCIGAQMSAVYAGTVQEWEASWPWRYAGWTAPALLDGAGVRTP